LCSQWFHTSPFHIVKFGLYCFKLAGDIFNEIFHPFFFLPQFTSCKSAKDLTKEHPQVDYTPPSYITLLFTDLGILTPSAVSDELIKLYLWNIICTYRVIYKITIFIPQINAICLIHPLTAFQYSMANMDLGHMQNSSKHCNNKYHEEKKSAECTVEPGYNNTGLCDISYICQIFHGTN
jgi:hypothetical protein